MAVALRSRQGDTNTRQGAPSRLCTFLWDSSGGSCRLLLVSGQYAQRVWSCDVRCCGVSTG